MTNEEKLIQIISQLVSLIDHSGLTQRLDNKDQELGAIRQMTHLAQTQVVVNSRSVVAHYQRTGRILE